MAGDESSPVTIAINQAEYTNAPGGPVVHIFGRTAEGVAHHLQITEFRPYFWVWENEADLPHSDTIEVTQDKAVSIKGEPLRRIYTGKPTDVRIVRDHYHHYEADIPFATRFLIDTGLTGGVTAPSEVCSYTELAPAVVHSKPRVCMCDIECDDRNGFPEPERDPITCLTCHDSYDDHYTTFVLLGKTHVDYYDHSGLVNGCFIRDRHTICVYQTEKELFTAFITYIQEKDPDILSGWNFADFDADYILKRAQALGFKSDVFARIPGTTERNAMRGRVIFDLLTAYKKMQGSQKESYRLDAIAEEELGERKVRYTGTLGDLWNNDPLKMVEYNFKDVELCVGINRKNNIIEFYQEVSRYVGCPLDKALNSSNVIDIYILRKAYGKFVLPSKGNSAGEEFEGATVFAASKGVKENVIVLDLKSLYPMAMMTLNASPETKSPEGEIHAPNGIRFRREPDGLTRSIISELMAERDDRKKLRNTFPYGSQEYTLYDMQQNVLKVIMNTYYGVSGFSRFRLYDRDIGSAVTSVGRAIIQHTKNIITARGYEVIYGDTDSCFVQLPKVSQEETMKIARELEAELNASYIDFSKDTLAADQNYFSIKFEKIYRRFFQGGAKKRYAGHLVWKEGQDVDKIDITGFEMKRSDSAPITREVQERVLEMILKGNGKAEVKEYLPEVLRMYRAGRCPLEKAGIPSGINKSLDDYTVLDAHGRGAKYSNTYLGTDFKRGSKPKRLYIKRSYNPETYPNTDVLCFEYPDQIPDGMFEIDWETMLEKTIQAPLTRIFDALGWDWDEFDPTKTKKTTLDMFF
ncbi:MAG TPA: DNA-directed DNA polymerase [Methanocorpusculum sp.]|nr:DNA-directed DNA polymerase [Candidatus Methanocorpusculum faecipullorum]HJK24650.1 DNA-directed DNA polymerase [Methanocorpusculum sp.]HJK28502.1 DNA-directed DNA polymerase [Methanocorpusculum sp.]HJK33233.1 DNA-directed DNA polymerase [Methanocorpusculum sp.]HJK35679.1 DNA-directed DNA polymerase [Methanocorpusculum sp.]